MENALVDVEKLLQGIYAQQSASPVAAAYSQQAMREAVTRWLRRVSSLRVSIKGSHYGGLSNQRLLTLRKQEGRDFAFWTVQLKQELQRKAQARYSSLKRIPTQSELEAFCAPLALERVVARVERGGLDVLIEKLSDAYSKRKKRDGYGSKPVGVRKGKWLEALRLATVRFVY